MEPEEPDYEAIWKQLIANAERFVAEQDWQARWFDEASVAFGRDARYAAQRGASKAFIRQTLQYHDLAAAINEGDTAAYIERWYPAPTPNGPNPTFVHSDEIALFDGTLLDGFGWDAHVRWSASYDNPPAIWRKYLARVKSLCERQTGSSLVKRIPTWVEGEDRMGPRSRLRRWARRLYRHRP
jgi:hypothetical protein